MENKDDRISDLPDPIIQHILSFLPSTKQSVQTCVLSKRWLNQWTRVPVLIFDSDGMSYENFLKFIDNALLLHDCSKIYKFQLRNDDLYGEDSQFAEKIYFAIRKHVEELNLSALFQRLLLPEFLFHNDSLVQLSTNGCQFLLNEKVNWRCLSSLEIVDCVLPHHAMENILSGSPSLTLLKLSCRLNEIVIASKSLKRLFIHFCVVKISVVEISCPNLKELSLNSVTSNLNEMFFSQAIQNALSISLSLESFEMIACDMRDQRLVIASKSMKKLVLNSPARIIFDIEISCPQLEELKLLGTLHLTDAKFLNLPSSLRATIEFRHYWEQKYSESLNIKILQQLQHLKELKIGSCFLKALPTIQMEALFSPVLNIKCLTLNVKCLAVDSPYLEEHHSGIAHLLHISPLLEKLVINVPQCFLKVNQMSIWKKYWDSIAAVFDCLVSHLKTIKIMGFPGRGGRREHMLILVKFLLKNARVLQKMVILLGDQIRTSKSDISQILLRLPRCSQNAIIEVL